MTRIDVNSHFLNEGKQEFIAKVFKACNELFSGGNMIISISKKTSFSDISIALSQIAEIINIGALMVKDKEEKEKEQRDGYDGWLDPKNEE